MQVAVRAEIRVEYTPPVGPQMDFMSMYLIMQLL